jgi:hypothetical protein
MAPLALTTENAVLLEEALRRAIKPPSVCFQQPQACGLNVRALSLAALRPAEMDVERLAQQWPTQRSTWTVSTRFFHCEALCAWRPSAGLACAQELAAEGHLTDDRGRPALLHLLDVLGPHADGLALSWVSHADLAVRRDAARWLSSRALVDSLVAPVLGLLARERDDEVGESLIRAFATLLDPDAVPVLSAIALRSGQSRARVAAVDTLTVLVGTPLRSLLSQMDVRTPEVASAVARAHARLDAWDEGAEVLPLSGLFGVFASETNVHAGGLAFAEDFRLRRQRSLQILMGERLTRGELEDAFAWLTDAGGYGLAPLRTSLSVSGEWQDLGRVVELRRAIHAAGLPNRDVLAAEVTEVGRVIRMHYALGRPTRYWRTPVSAVGEPLRFTP